jgi:hypothetical protein
MMERSTVAHRRRCQHTPFGLRDDRCNMQAVDKTPPGIAGIYKSGRGGLRILTEQYVILAFRPGIPDRLRASQSLVGSALARE